MYQNIQKEVNIFLLFLFSSSVTSSLNYQELEELGVSCPPQDTCRNRTGADAVNKNTCECDPSCAEKGTCCIDSPYTEIGLTHTLECIPIPERNTGCHESYGMWVVTKCSPKWNGSSDVKELCEGDALRIGNLLMLVAVRSPASELTYRNYFCAVCNEDHHGAVLWNVTLTKLEHVSRLGYCEHDAEQDFTYKEETGNWGYWNYFAPGEAIFVPVTVTIRAIYVEHAASCRKDIVRGCHNNWRDDSVREKCEAYMAVVQGPLEYEWDGYRRRVFRNVHCAICNDVTWFDQFSCDAYYLRRLGRWCGEEVGNFVTVLFGHKMLTRECREKGKELLAGINKCRPVISRGKKG